MASLRDDDERARLLLILTAGMSAQKEAMSGGGGGGGIPGLGLLAAAGSLLRLRKRSEEFVQCGSQESEEDATWHVGSRRCPQSGAALCNANSKHESTATDTGEESSTTTARGITQPSLNRLSEAPTTAAETGRGVFYNRSRMGEAGGGGGRTLREGATVCFYTKDGERLMVVQNGKFWELQPCGGEQDPGGAAGAGDGSRVQYFSPKCLFLVKRRDKNIIFQSLGAEGRSLQALSGPIPHRCTNHNLGPWESWEPTAQGLMNVKWSNKPLGYDVHEVSCVATEDLRKIERGQLRTSRIVQQQVRSAEERVLESERKRNDVVRANQRQATLHQKEIDEIRSRLEETQQQNQRQEVDSLRMSAAQQQLELRIEELSKDKEALDCTHQSAQSCIEALKRELHLEKERHVISVREVERSFQGEVRSLQRERDLDLQRAKDFTEKQQKQVHDEIQQREHQRALLVQRLTSEHKNAMKVKEAEIRQLVKECHRLMSILKRIKTQMEDAQQARQSYEAAQAAPPGWAPWHRRGSQSFVPLHSASSVVQNDPALFSSGGSQMDYPLRGSPVPGSLSGMPMDMMNGHPGAAFPNYRNPRASPPASAMSGDWMELSASKTIVEEWMEKGRGQADGLYGKQISSDGSATGVERTSSGNMGPGRDRLSKQDVERPEHASDGSAGKDSDDARVSPDLKDIKAFGSLTPHKEPKGKWEAAQELTVTTPSLDKEESNPPRSPEAIDGIEEGMFSPPEAVAVP